MSRCSAKARFRGCASKGFRRFGRHVFGVAWGSFHPRALFPELGPARKVLNVSSAASSIFAAVTTHRELIENLVVRDIKTRYKQSLLGFAWAVVTPLMTAFIYTIVGKYFFKESTHIPYPVFAYYGLLFWGLFQSGLLSATDSLVAHLSLITKVKLPREVFPVSAVVGKLVDFGFGLVGLLPLLLWCRVLPDRQIILIVPLVVIVIVFTMGLGMLMACANLFYRDVRYLVGLVLNFWMWMVPNLYPIERVPPRFLALYLLNPMATIIEAARRLSFPRGASVVDWPLGGPSTTFPWLFVCFAALSAAATFAAGLAVFKRYEPLFAESI